MNKTYPAVAVVVVIIAGLAIWHYQSKSSAQNVPMIPATTTSTSSASVADQGLGTYPYECDEHVTFSMTPSSDMSSIVLAPRSGSYPATTTLVAVKTASGVEYQGGGITFTAKGEGVVLNENNTPINCSPVQDPNNAPFNFGD